MHEFSNIYSEMLICSLIGAISGYVRLRIEKVPRTQSNICGYVVVGILAALTGVGVVTHFTTRCETLIAVSICCGQFGERVFDMCSTWLKRLVTGDIEKE